MAEVCANSEEPDQMLHSAASVLGLNCLPNTLLEVSRLQWVANSAKTKMDRLCRIRFINCNLSI